MEACQLGTLLLKTDLYPDLCLAQVRLTPAKAFDLAPVLPLRVESVRTLGSSNQVNTSGDFCREPLSTREIRARTNIAGERPAI